MDTSVVCHQIPVTTVKCTLLSVSLVLLEVIVARGSCAPLANHRPAEIHFQLLFYQHLLVLASTKNSMTEI